MNDHGIFTLEELNELSNVVRPHLSAFHLNIRSLSKHIDELHNLLDNIPFEFDIIACSETWITPQVDRESIKIAGYNLLTDNREFSVGGGSRRICGEAGNTSDRNSTQQLYFTSVRQRLHNISGHIERALSGNKKRVQYFSELQ